MEAAAVRIWAVPIWSLEGAFGPIAYNLSGRRPVANVNLVTDQAIPPPDSPARARRCR